MYLFPDKYSPCFKGQKCSFVPKICWNETSLNVPIIMRTMYTSAILSDVKKTFYTLIPGMLQNKFQCRAEKKYLKTDFLIGSSFYLDRLFMCFIEKRTNSYWNLVKKDQFKIAPNSKYRAHPIMTSHYAFNQESQQMQLMTSLKGEREKTLQNTKCIEVATMIYTFLLIIIITSHDFSNSKISKKKFLFFSEVFFSRDAVSLTHLNLCSPRP